MTTIRRLGPSDLVWMRLLNAMFSDAFEDPASYHDAPPPDDYLSDLLAQPSFIALASIEDGAVVSGLVAYELRKFEQRRSEIYIYDLATAESHRRRGLARALIGHLKPIAQACGAQIIFVQADRDDPPAIALYESVGRRESVLHFDIEAG